jgi:hypothetical protein
MKRIAHKDTRILESDKLEWQIQYGQGFIYASLFFVQNGCDRVGIGTGQFQDKFSRCITSNQ